MSVKKAQYTWVRGEGANQKQSLMPQLQHHHQNPSCPQTPPPLSITIRHSPNNSTSSPPQRFFLPPPSHSLVEATVPSAMPASWSQAQCTLQVTRTILTPIIATAHSPSLPQPFRPLIPATRGWAPRRHLWLPRKSHLAVDTITITTITGSTTITISFPLPGHSIPPLLPP